METNQKLQGRSEEVEEVVSEVAVEDLVQEDQVSSGLYKMCFICWKLFLKTLVYKVAII